MRAVCVFGRGSCGWAESGLRFARATSDITVHTRHPTPPPKHKKDDRDSDNWQYTPPTTPPSPSTMPPPPFSDTHTSVPQITTPPPPSSLFFSSPNIFDVLDEGNDDAYQKFQDFPSFPPSRPLPQPLSPSGVSAGEGGFFALSTLSPSALSSIRTLNVYPPSLLSSLV